MIPKEVIQKVRRIEIKTKRVVDSILSGEYHSAFKGRDGVLKVRNYIEGDDIRSIDWNVTARMDHLISKNTEERSFRDADGNASASELWFSISSK
jgi:uncharacterized protein (DUF58 family)